MKRHNTRHARFPGLGEAVWEYLNQAGSTVVDLGSAKAIDADPINQDYLDRPVWHNKTNLDRYVANKLGLDFESYGKNKHANPLYTATVSEISSLRKAGTIIDLNPSASNLQMGIWRISDKIKVERHEKESADIEMESGNFYSSGRLQSVFVRQKQRKFRAILLKQYGKCLFCKFALEPWMRGAHIVPYKIIRHKDPKHSMHPSNGLLLCSMCDIAFEYGYITADEDYTIRIKEYLLRQDNATTRTWVKSIRKKMQIKVESTQYPPAPKYLKEKAKLLARLAP